MNKNYMVYMIQSIMIYNALASGWTVNIKSNKSFEIVKTFDSKPNCNLKETDSRTFKSNG